MLLASLAALAWVQTAPANTEQPQPEAGETAETVIAPPPTDAATLIAGIESRYDAYGELSAELAARRTRERYLAGLLLPAIGRTDLDEGARGAILQTIGAQLSALETDNTQWAVGQLDPARFATLHAEEPRLAQDLLRWAERHRGGVGTGGPQRRLRRPGLCRTRRPACSVAGPAANLWEPDPLRGGS